MREVGVLEAKTHFSKLLDDVEQRGEEIVITRNGRRIASLSPHDLQTRWRNQYQQRVAEAIQRLRELGRGPFDPEPDPAETDSVRELLGREPLEPSDSGFAK